MGSNGFYDYNKETDWVVEALFSTASGWRPVAWPADEPEARSLLDRASREYPAETLLRLRHGPAVLMKMPADGSANVRE